MKTIKIKNKKYKQVFQCPSMMCENCAGRMDQELCQALPKCTGQGNQCIFVEDKEDES